MFLTRLIGLFSDDIVIDLGTSSTIIYVKGKGIVLNEPSVVAVLGNYRNRQVLAVGTEAKLIAQRLTNQVTLISPISGGVITDFDMAQTMIRLFITKATGSWFFSRPRVIISVPIGSTSVERRAIEDAVLHCRASKVYLIEAPMAAAIGAGIAVHQQAASLVVNCGGGKTEVAAISSSKVVKFCSLRIGGEQLDGVIIDSMRSNHGIVIDEYLAERIKIKLGCALIPAKATKHMKVTGIDASTAAVKEIETNDLEIAEALYRPLASIVEGISLVLQSVPEEMSADIVNRGIVLTGGGAVLKGLDQLISNATSLPVIKATNPALCVVMGASKALAKLNKYIVFGKAEMLTK